MDARKVIAAALAALALSSAAARDLYRPCHEEACPWWKECVSYAPCKDRCWIEPWACCHERHRWSCDPVPL